MNLTRFPKYLLLAFVLLRLQPVGTCCADVFDAEEFGFRFTIPDGFFEQTDEEPMILADGTPMTVALFTEDLQTDEMLIAIYIQRLGQIVDPSQRLDLSKLPKQDAIKLSLETRQWQKTELQVIRQEANLGPDMDVLGFLIQFPLKDEAIQVRVQGPQSRGDEVLNAFNMSVEGFVNTKTYIKNIEPTRTSDDSAQVAKLILGLLAIAVLGVLLICVADRIRGPKGKRPHGIVVIAFLGLSSSVWAIGQHLPILIKVLTSSDGSVSMSNAFTVNLVGDLFFSLLAIVLLQD